MKHSGQIELERVSCAPSHQDAKPGLRTKQYGSLYYRADASYSNFRKPGRPAKLSPQEKDEIFKIREYYSIRQLARIFNVSRSCIMRALQ